MKDYLKEAVEARTVCKIGLELLVNNHRNRFNKIDGDKWDVFLASVSSYGIVQPIIVRPIENGARYEIIAGHNRVRAARKVGMVSVPAIVEELDDVEASVIMGLTNQQRETTTDMEWGWTYRDTYEAILKTVEIDKNPLYSHHGNKDYATTLDLVAGKYGVSKNTIYRKIRLTYLEPQLVRLYESKLITQEIAIELSYLRPREQGSIAGLIVFEGYDMSKEIAIILKQASRKNHLTVTEIALLWNQTNRSGKTARQRRYFVQDSLFPAWLKKGERDAYLEKVLRYVNMRGIDVRDD